MVRRDYKMGSLDLDTQASAGWTKWVMPTVTAQAWSVYLLNSLLKDSVIRLIAQDRAKRSTGNGKRELQKKLPAI